MAVARVSALACPRPVKNEPEPPPMPSAPPSERCSRIVDDQGHDDQHVNNDQNRLHGAFQQGKPPKTCPAAEFVAS